MNPMSDSSRYDSDELIARARAGDQAAWEELFHTCYPKVIRVVRRKLIGRCGRCTTRPTS